jgi:hypothetical protein
MRTILTSILALGAMTSVTLAAEPSGRAVLSEQQMDKVAAGVCIGNCPGQKTQIGVGVQASCVIGGNNCGNRQGQRQ